MSRAGSSPTRSRKKRADEFREVLKKFLKEDDAGKLSTLWRLIAGHTPITKAARGEWSLFLMDFRKRIGELHDFAYTQSVPAKPLVLAMDYLARKELLGKATAAKKATADAWEVSQSVVTDAITDYRTKACVAVDTYVMYQKMQCGRLTDTRQRLLETFLEGLPKRFTIK